MKNLPTDLLRTFVTVAEIQGFTHAGEKLGRSQPAISLQVKRLEKLLDRTLLARNGNQIELTESGQQLFRYAKQILALNDEAIDQFNQTSVSGNIRFGNVARLVQQLAAGTSGTLGGVMASSDDGEWIFRKEPPRRT